ncbi:hypothetical protein SLH46_19275 [Draconibacterium sp. IB214405]|uniref:hypothetical protein n=1 Tax=Draconibacterium sp. IB214405 TaxID=3097352 RepID=UPI002A14F480|nr:hypothetical protein [Draconibacterium sp. IB214405]MDX8341349.1 hypothetical protein [Draconibacterium sp. IB214405]
MRALFALLLIYFLTGILQVTGINNFGKKSIGLANEPEATAIECSVSAEIDLSESVLESLEDQDSKTTAYLFANANSNRCRNKTKQLRSGKVYHIQKSLLLFYTNLPPPFQNIQLT